MRGRTLRPSAWLAVLLLFGACDRDPVTDAERVVKVFGESGLGPGQFSYPRALAISPVDGRLFVCDKTARIQRFDPDGRFEHAWRMPDWQAGKPTGMTVDSAGRLWVADTHYSRVIVFDRQGREQFRFGSQGTGPGQFLLPTFVGFDREGNCYVGEYGGHDRVSKFDSNRRFLFDFGGRGSGDAALERPTAMRCDARDVLWVADGCHHRLCRFDVNGRYLGRVGKPGTGPDDLNFPYDLEMLPGEPGGLLVADNGRSRIVEFDLHGRFVRAWGRPGRRLGELLHPWAVARGTQGRVYVLDSWNNRVQVVRWR